MSFDSATRQPSKRSGMLVQRTLVAAAVLTVGQLPGPAFGIDVTGTWDVVFTPTSVTCLSQFVQSGPGTLSINGSCSSGIAIALTGTIDPNTGSLQAQGSASGAPCTALAITGTASPDGNSMNGSWTCDTIPGNFTGTRSPCGCSPSKACGPRRGLS
jgi:hypothetical protein